MVGRRLVSRLPEFNGLVVPGPTMCQGPCWLAVHLQTASDHTTTCRINDRHGIWWFQRDFAIGEGLKSAQ